MRKMRRVMCFLTAVWLAVAAGACHEDDGPERGYLTVYGFDTVRVDERVKATYYVTGADTAEVAMYLCGPVDDLWPEPPHTLFTPEIPDLAALLERTNGRRMNDRVMVGRLGNDYPENWRVFYWWPTEEYVEEGRCYLWVMCARFVDRPDWPDEYWFFHFRVCPPEDGEKAEGIACFLTNQIYEME